MQQTITLLFAATFIPNKFIVIIGGKSKRSATMRASTFDKITVTAVAEAMKSITFVDLVKKTCKKMRLMNFVNL